MPAISARRLDAIFSSWATRKPFGARHRKGLCFSNLMRRFFWLARGRADWRHGKGQRHAELRRRNLKAVYWRTYVPKLLKTGSALLFAAPLRRNAPNVSLPSQRRLKQWM